MPPDQPKLAKTVQVGTMEVVDEDLSGNEHNNKLHSRGRVLGLLGLVHRTNEKA